MEGNKDFIRLPRTVVQMGEEIKRAVNMYWNRELSEIELKELFWAWASSGMLLEANDLNISVKKIIGKKRTSLALKLLEGYQGKF